jgi:glycosyltransferase involved in cell wall biosynthesis
MSDSVDKKKDVLVTVVAPIVDDAEIMVAFVKEVLELAEQSYTNYELVLVDGGVEAEVIEEISTLLNEFPCIRIIRLSQKTNRDVMLFAGLEAAIGDYVVVMMPNTDPPRVIVDLVNIMTGGQDIVFGLSKTPIRRTLLASFGARLFYWYGRKYLGLNIPPDATYLVGLNRRSINALTRIKGRYRHVRHLTRQVGFKTAVYQYSPLPSDFYSKERGLLESVRLAKEIVVSYSHHPLRVVSWLGLVASGVNLLYAAYAIIVYILNKKVSEGWTTLSLELAVMFFVLFIILSVMCEYIGRILEETRVQPAYHIMEELVSTALVADATRRNITK